jgi:hypothetical protein
MKNFEPLNKLDRENLHELVTNPRMEVVKKLAERLIGLYERAQIAPCGPDETQFQYERRQFNNEGAIQATKDFLLFLESESYPEEQPNADGIQQGDNPGDGGQPNNTGS